MKYSTNNSFRVNVLNKKVSKAKLTLMRNKNLSKYQNASLNNNRTYQMSNSNVAHKNQVSYPLNRKLKLARIRTVKKEYHEECLRAIEVIQDKGIINKKVIKKNYKKLILTTLLILVVGLGSFLAAEKTIYVIIDGVKEERVTNQIISSLYVDSLAREQDFEKYKMETKDDVISDKDTLEIRNYKTLNLKIRNQPLEYSTYTNTLEELIDELNPKLKEYGEKKYSFFVEKHQKNQDKVFLKDVKDFDIALLSKKVDSKVINKKYKIKYVDNSKLESGELKIKQKGENAKYVAIKEVLYLNDKYYKTINKVGKVYSKGKNQIVERGTRVVSTSSSVWDRLAKCESGGRWHANTGNGFYGGLQFHPQTWLTAARNVGVTAKYAHQASKADQIKAAVWLQKKSGWGQWPACSRKLGLR